MKLMESRLPGMYSRALLEEKGLDLSGDHMDKIVDTVFTGTAMLLNAAKSAERPTAFVFKKIDGSFIAGVLVQFFENTDQSLPGNWSLAWTFENGDIPNNALVLSLDNVDTHSYFRAVAGEKYGMRFEMQSDLVDCCTMVILQLKKWLDENATEGNVISIEQDGIFEARVSIENGEKVFAITPDGEIKNLIKDDAAIEK